MIQYILFNEDNTEVINTILSKHEIVNGIITSDPSKLVKLEPHTCWNSETKTIQPILESFTLSAGEIT